MITTLNLRNFLGVILVLILPAKNAIAAEPNFNGYILRAYRLLNQDPPRGLYDKNSYFTKNLDYGSEKGVIKHGGRGDDKYTMCNAAVTETIIEAMNIYAKEHRNWSNPIPKETWNSSKWSDLRAHFFGHDYYERGKLEELSTKDKKEVGFHKTRKEIPIWLDQRIKNFHSERGMSIALQQFGLGEAFISFKEAIPGDVITFDRTRGPGHSVIFLSFLTRDEREIPRARKGDVVGRDIVGFKYFSAQKFQPEGLTERWAYFTEPLKEASKEKPRDCCVVMDKENGPRVGRVLMPQYWSRFERRQKEVKANEDKLKAAVKDYLEIVSRRGAMLKLYAKGAVALEKEKGADHDLATNYISRVKSKFDLDLRDIAADTKAPEITRSTFRSIWSETPPKIVKAANEQVTKKMKDEIERNVRLEAGALAEAEHSRGGVPNSRFDGQTTN
jgi:hypothetical protein